MHAGSETIAAHRQPLAANFLVAAALVATAGCGSRSGPPSEAEQAAVAQIQQLGGRIAQRDGQNVTVILGGTDVTDDDLRLLKELPKLELLNLQNTAITDAGMVHLAGLERLERLSLQKSQVTDEGLAQLAGLENLIELDLVGINMTDAGLEPLRGLTKLEKLYVDAGSVSAAGARELERGLPKLYVFRN